MEDIGIAGLDEPNIPSFMNDGMDMAMKGGAQNGIVGTLDANPRPGGIAKETATDVGVNVSFPGEVNKTTVAQRNARPAVDNGFYPTGKKMGAASNLSIDGSMLKDQYNTLLASAKKAAANRARNFATPIDQMETPQQNPAYPGGRMTLTDEAMAEMRKDTGFGGPAGDVGAMNRIGGPVAQQNGVKKDGSGYSYMNNNVSMQLPIDIDINDDDAVGSMIGRMNSMFEMMNSYSEEV